VAIASGRAARAARAAREDRCERAITRLLVSA